MARVDKKKKLIRRISVVGDGVTEKIYFEQLKELEQVKGVVIKPELPNKRSKGGSFKKVFNTAKSLVDDGYDHVYCLIDYDTVISENKLEEFAQELRGVNSNKITVYVNNPCFEAWVLVHYERTGKEFADCDSVTKSIAKHLKDYCKKPGIFTKKEFV